MSTRVDFFKTVVILIMKKIPMALLAVIVTIIGLAGFYLGKTNQPKAITPTLDSKTLVGIWQAGPSMAAGWNDRYHFYADGKFHFYPNQMDCLSDNNEYSGTWEISKGTLSVNITNGVPYTSRYARQSKECKNSHLTTKIPQNPISDYLGGHLLGTIEGDFYPSAIFGGSQYWKFSDDPSSYGDEKFLNE